MRIVFDAIEPADREVVERELTGHDIVFLETPFTEVTKEMEQTDILSVFVQSPVSKEMIERMPNLRLIAARSMGYDHIDISAAQARGVKVCTVPTYGVRTVAEFAFALILALSRKAFMAYERLKLDGAVDVGRFEGFDLAGKTIGIIGTGNIGKNTAKIARGFAMDILLFDVHPDQPFAADVQGTYVPLEELVSRADIVSVHVPLLPSTQHLVNAALLAKFKSGSYLINTSRGGVVDTAALADSLASGHLAGAGLDVIEGERTLFDEMQLLHNTHNDITEFREHVAAHVLLDMPNVILTPHIAFNSKEAKREIILVTVRNIASFIAGKPEHVVAV